jgi:predicted RNA-binding protein (virulence factor B family)
LVYQNEVFKKISVGDNIKGFIKNIRPDHKIDVSLQAIGYVSVEPAANIIYQILKKEGGYLNLHDKSSPEEISSRLQMSKKIFKKSLGTLYKDRKITIKPDGIYLA